MLLLKQILSCMPRNQQMRSDKLSWLAARKWIYEYILLLSLYTDRQDTIENGSFRRQTMKLYQCAMAYFRLQPFFLRKMYACIFTAEQLGLFFYLSAN